MFVPTRILFLLGLTILLPFGAPGFVAAKNYKTPVTKMTTNEYVRVVIEFADAEIRTLDSWISQLNHCYAEPNQDTELRQRLVYGIEMQLEKLSITPMTQSQIARMKSAMSKLSPAANAAFVKDVARWRKQMTANLKYGEEQLNAMLDDRPLMREYVSQNDSLWEYVVRNFAGFGIGTRIVWDNGELEGPGERTAESFCSYESPYADNRFKVNTPYKRPTAGIRIGKLNANKRPKNGEELWADLIFEFNNLQNTVSFHRLWEQLLARKLTKEQWTKETTRLEYKAAKRTTYFYGSFWVPNCRGKRLVSNANYWSLGAAPDYETWIAGIRKYSAYPSDSWGMMYEDGLAYKRGLDAFWRKVEQMDKAAEVYRKR